MNEIAINFKNVEKSYNIDFSLKSVSFEIKKGSIFALLGPNGAGKTTLVKCALDLLNFENGEITICDFSSKNKEARLNVAFIPERFNFFPFYTVEGVLNFFGKMKNVENKLLENQIQDALFKFNLLELKTRKLKTLSKGQLQRVGLATILIGDNQLIILDEPFSGLDPIGARDLKNILRNLKLEGKTIFLNSHVLSEMEKICDEFAILNKGELIYCGKIEEALVNHTNLEDFFYEKVSTK